MNDRSEDAQRQVYDLYDSYLAALREGNRAAMLSAYAQIPDTPSPPPNTPSPPPVAPSPIHGTPSPIADTPSGRTHPGDRFTLRREHDLIASSEPGPVIDITLSEITTATKSLDIGLDVYAVVLRGEEAIALVEEWIDDHTGGSRRTRLAIETLSRSESHGWQIARSTAEEARSSLR
ncbi:MAG: hypothetical protein M3Z66_03785 [Chloroflexota bacterium]|nr:hypothetical protein [Chloroflexota bacterium]